MKSKKNCERNKWMVPGADLAGLELAGGDGDEVRLDGDLLQEAVEPLLAAVD